MNYHHNTKSSSNAFHCSSNYRQQGIVAIGLVLFIVIVFSAFLATATSLTSNSSINREKVTQKALSQAKEGLLAYMESVQLNTGTECDGNCTRPGDLPCPDMNNDGVSETSCGKDDGSTGQDKRLGRLPWKTLRLPDLRDGHGERLWYAVSNNFKNNFKHLPLNSDTVGTITLRQANGNILHDGQGDTGLVAIVISPGAVITRQGEIIPQQRNCTRGGGIDETCVATQVCATTSPALTNMCNPKNYLDIYTGLEDNAQFRDGDKIDGFIYGPIKDANGNFIVNDRLALISSDEVIPIIEKRVIQEVRSCLESYGKANNGRYPWTTRLDSASPLNFNDSPNAFFGHIPDTPFASTITGAPSMKASWTASCKILSHDNWWAENKWKEFIFYGLSLNFSPADTPIGDCTNCLKINPSESFDKAVVVMASGKKLPGQIRSDNLAKSNIANYLELENRTPENLIFQQGNISAAFNDQLTYLKKP